jgi:hypothetical protein
MMPHTAVMLMSVTRADLFSCPHLFPLPCLLQLRQMLLMLHLQRVALRPGLHMEQDCHIIRIIWGLPGDRPDS